jgi:hypothetical protein
MGGRPHKSGPVRVVPPGRFSLVPSDRFLAFVQSLVFHRLVDNCFSSRLSFVKKHLAHMLPEKSRKDMVSAAVFGCRGRYLSQIGGMYSLRDQPIRGQYATSVARGWHASLICHDTSVFTTPSLIDGEGRQPISLGGVAQRR